MRRVERLVHSQASVAFSPERRSRDRTTWAALFVMAFLPRALYLFWARPPIENYHCALADALLTDGSLSIGGVRTTAFEPRYPLLLSALRVFVGNRLVLV